MEIKKILESLELTKNEIKIYLEVLNLGKTKANKIAETTLLHTSKIYESLQRLIEKGLVSYVIENKIKYFQTTPLSSLNLILEEKETELKENKKLLKSLMPDLEILQNKSIEETDIRVYKGWKSMKFIYSELRDKLTSKDTNYILGASKGENEKITKLFFEQHLTKLASKKIKQKIIYNLNAKNNIENSYKYKKLFQIKYIPYNTPTEFNMFKDTTMLVFLKKDPIIIIIKNQQITDAFLIYFNLIWGTATKD
ncbi:MAG: hypothetical protein HRU03_06555 [Nanoarchaeales archaeon]|nr:hypothetical protein [Nanoarchaeales archaeon]